MSSVSQVRLFYLTIKSSRSTVDWSMESETSHSKYVDFCVLLYFTLQKKTNIAHLGLKWILRFKELTHTVCCGHLKKGKSNSET